MFCYCSDRLAGGNTWSGNEQAKVQIIFGTKTEVIPIWRQFCNITNKVNLNRKLLEIAHAWADMMITNPKALVHEMK